MCRRALVLGLLLVTGGTLDAQVIATGIRVRVWSAQPRLSKVEGTVVARQGDTLVIERRRAAQPEYSSPGPLGPDTIRVAWNAMRRLDVWQGISHARGALKGLLFGFGIGLAVGAFDVARRNELPALPFLAIGGAATGTFLGALFGSERWLRVYR